MIGIVILCFMSLYPDRDFGDFSTSHRYPGVCVADGMEFPVDALTAKVNWQQARDHITIADGYMQTYFYPKSYQLWRSEAEWAKDCWDQLDNFHRAKTEATWWGGDEDLNRRERKLYALSKLRELLGEEAYNARLMPTTVVTWLK